MFLQNAQAYRRPLVAQGAYAAGGQTNVPLLNLGYLAGISVVVSISYTVVPGGGTAVVQSGRGKVQGNPTPFDLINKVQLFNNQQVPLIDVSGWGLYLYNQTQRTGFDPLYQTGKNSDLSYNPFYNIPAAGTAVVTGTMNIPLYIPVAYKKALYSGLLFMQNQQNSMQLVFTWGNGSFITLAGGATAVVNNITVSASQEYFMVGDSAEDQPDISMVHRLLEKTYDITGTGVTTVKPDLVQRRFIQQAIIECVGNGVGLTDANINRFTWQVSGSDGTVSVPPAHQLLRQMEHLGKLMPKGAYVFSFDGGNGLPEIPSPRDVVDLSRVTEFALDVDITPATNVTGGYTRAIFDFLEEVPQG